MKITEMSDLHLEFSTLEINNDQHADVLILAGDILMAEILHDYPYESTQAVQNSSRYELACRFRKFLASCSDLFKDVIMIAGNHEFYQGKFFSGLDYLKDECANYHNIHFLENSSVKIDDVLFVGATLWTDANNSDPLTMYQLPNMMNDYKLIKNDHNGYIKLSINDTIKRHHKSMEYIKSIVENSPSEQKIVMVSHHSPSYLSIIEKYARDYEMNGGYHSDLSKFILDNPSIKLWVFGHVHSVLDYHIGTTRLVCNPRGYENDTYHENTGWNPNLIIEI